MRRTTRSAGAQKPASRKTRGPRAPREAATPKSRAAQGFHTPTPYELFTAAVGSNAVTDSWQRGLRKLEEVFDERVASALERLGIPSAAALSRLERKIDQLAVEFHAFGSRRHRS